MRETGDEGGSPSRGAGAMKAPRQSLDVSEDLEHGVSTGRDELDRARQARPHWALKPEDGPFCFESSGPALKGLSWKVGR